MKLDKTQVKREVYYNDYTVMLVNHLIYSLKDVNSYEELTPKEKEIISEEIWNKIKKPYIPNEDKILVPWIGNKYHLGIKSYDEDGIVIFGSERDPGKKLLILDSTSDKKDFRLEPNSRERISQYISPDHDPKISFDDREVICNLREIIIGAEWDHYDRSRSWSEYNEVWNHVSYLQFPVTKDPEFNKDLTCEWIKEIDPDLVIICGDQLYHDLSMDKNRTSFEFEVCNGDGEDTTIEGHCHDLLDRKIPIIGMNSRPVKGYDFYLWSNTIYVAFMNDLTELI